MVMKSALAFGILALSTLLPTVASGQERLTQHGRWFTNSAGQVATIRGGNVTLPEFNSAETVELRFSPETPARMAKQGFNGVRLVVFFSNIMPQPGVINHAYLDRIAQAIAAYKAAGIYTMIDFHQDQYGALVGVRGMPDWAVFSDGYKRIPGIEFPVGYFRDPAVQRSFDNFWKNHPVPGTGKGVQDFYLEGLAAVAHRFRSEPAVLGIDVMNEPATGSRCAQPDPIKADCPKLEQELLRPFYEKAAKAIGRAAPEMIVFVEPFMLQGALGTPINTPIVGKKNRRGFSFHNYGPVQATRDRVNDGALAHAISSRAAIINTEWGFSNDPAEVARQAADFDRRHISWLAWTRGAFEALVDPKLPDADNGNRIAVLRSYARPYAEITAGTPEAMEFDDTSGTMRYRYATTLPSGRKAGNRETKIRIPAIQYPNGYRVAVDGGTVSSPAHAANLTIRNAPRAKRVTITLSRVGDLPPLPQASGQPNRSEAALRALPPIPSAPLTRKSMLGHIAITSGGKPLLDRHVPGMLAGLSHVHGWEKMSLEDIQQYASGTLTDKKLAEIETDLAKLKVVPGPVRIPRAEGLSIDSLVSDLLANPRTKAILDREAPGLTTSTQQSLFPQTRLRNLQPALPDILSDEVLKRIQAAFDAL